MYSRTFSSSSTRIVGLLLLTALVLTVSARSTPINDSKNDNNYDYDSQDVQNDEEDYGLDTEDSDQPAGVQQQRSWSEPLVITSLPQTLEVDANSTVRLPCDTTSNFTPVYFWTKDGAAIFQNTIKIQPFGPNFRLETGDTSRTLVIDIATSNETANYTCAFMLGQNEYVNVTHRVFVRTPPQIVSLRSQHDSHQVDRGQTIVLSCTASGYPKPGIKWSHKGKRLPANGETLTIEDVEHRDAGDYQCLADNGIEPPAHSSIHIRVTQVPIIHIEKVTVSSDKNLDTELICQVQATPKAQVVWKKNGVNIVNGPRHRLTNDRDQHILEIKEVRQDDFGVYQCSAYNRLGSTEANVTLTGYPTPARIESIKHDHDRSTLAWTLESKAPIQKYQLEYKKIEDPNWSTISLDSVSPADGNTYTVNYTLTGIVTGTRYEARLRSLNTYGWSQHSDTVKFEGALHHHSHKTSSSLSEQQDKPAVIGGANHHHHPKNKKVAETHENDVTFGAEQRGPIQNEPIPPEVTADSQDSQDNVPRPGAAKSAIGGVSSTKDGGGGGAASASSGIAIVTACLCSAILIRRLH